MKFISSILICLFLFTGNFLHAQCTTFGVGEGPLIVPAGVTEATVIAMGASGQANLFFEGGTGSTIEVDFAVTPGDVFAFNIGAASGFIGNDRAAGGNGTEVTLNGTRIVVAGAGGGAGAFGPGLGGSGTMNGTMGGGTNGGAGGIGGANGSRGTRSNGTTPAGFGGAGVVGGFGGGPPLDIAAIRGGFGGGGGGYSGGGGGGGDTGASFNISFGGGGGGSGADASAISAPIITAGADGNAVGDGFGEAGSVMICFPEVPCEPIAPTFINNLPIIKL